MTLRPMWAVAVKELRQIRRDTRTLLTLLFVPAFFLLLYGYALSFDIRNISLAVLDADRSAESRDLVSAFVNSGYFDLVAAIDRDDDIGRMIDRNEARAVLMIPSQFGRDAAMGRPTSVQVIVNGDNANTATTVVGYVQALVASVSSQYDVAVQRGPAGPLVRLEPRVFYNPELRSTLFLVPGLIAYIAMLTAVVSTAMSIVGEKESGTMEQVRMSPVGPLGYIVGKTVPYFIVSFVSSMLIVVAAMLLFGMPMRGSWVLLLLTVSLFLVGALALGLLVSTVAETQQVAFQVALIVSFLPTLMLSGFIFPISSMPAFLQLVTRIVPARYFLVALRGIVLKGAGASAFPGDLVALGVFAVVTVALAGLRLRRQWA